MDEQKLVDDVKAAAEDNCIAVFSYGSIDNDKKDKRYLVIVEQLDFPVLQKLRRLSFEQRPLFLTASGLQDSLDVFPLEYLNIKANHEVLYGDDIFAKLKFDKKHVRRQLEFEFRSKLINLRDGYLQATEKDLKTILMAAVGTLMPICNGMLFLKNARTPASVGAVFQSINERYNVDMGILHTLYTVSNEGARLENPHTLVEQLVVLLEKLGNKLDKMKL